MSKWISKAGTEPEWGNYYPKTLKDEPDLVNLINQAFLKSYGLDFNDLNEISKFLEQIAVSHQQEVHPISALYGKFPLLQLEKMELFDVFSKNMDKRRANKWIKKLTYKPWKNLYMMPLLPLKRSKKDRFFALAHWVLSPLNQFWSAWYDDLMTMHPQTTIHGKILNWFGDRFEQFVDHKIERTDFGKNKVINVFKGKEWKIKVKDFPEIKSWLNKIPPNGKENEFGIDRVIIKDNLIFLISCKARVYMLERKLPARDYFFPMLEMINRIHKNIDHMEEINIETKYISQSSAIIQNFGLVGDYFIPIMVTPSYEPLAIDELRLYFSQEIRMVPKVPIITISKFIELLKKSDDEILQLEYNRFGISP